MNDALRSKLMQLAADNPRKIWIVLLPKYYNPTPENEPLISGFLYEADPTFVELRPESDNPNFLDLEHFMGFQIR